MNIEFIKRQIYNLKDNDDRIQPGDHISAEAISILKDGRAVDRLACFAPINSGETYTADILCSDCQSVLTQTISKTRLIAYLDGSKPIFWMFAANKIQHQDGCWHVMTVKTN